MKLRKPIPKISKDPKRAARRFIPKAVLVALQERSEGRCEAGRFTDNSRCCRRGTDPHHRLARSQGGKHELENLVHLCSTCHRMAHDQPQWAIRWGISIPYAGYDALP